MTTVAHDAAAPLSSRRVAIPRVLDACAPPDPAATLRRVSGPTMGTTWSVAAMCPPGVGHDVLVREVTACCDRVIAEMSTWVESSVLSRFNRSAGEWQALPGWFGTVLGCALDVARASGGAYDPTVGPLVDLWGFGPSGRPAGVPDPAAIDAARARCGWNRLDLDRATGHARQPGGMALDFSAIAKGFAVDAVADRLAALGVQSALVEIGGELRGRGVKPDGQPWWVGVEAPPGAGASVPCELLVALHGLSIATSGDYRNGYVLDGRWHSHTIDPRTGRPVAHDLCSVTVLHRDCMQADALATAIMVMGADEGHALATALDVPALLVRRTPGGFDALQTPALDLLLD